MPTTSYRPDPLDLKGKPDLRTDLLPYFANFIQQRREKNMDTFICVTGPEGWGKSSLGLQAALHINPDLNPDNIILEQDDYYRVYDPSKRDQTYVFDEAGRLLFNRNWNRRGQKALIQEIMEMRQNRNVIFLHIPQFSILDKYVREGRIPLWFACTAQGRAMVRKMNYNSYTEETYYPIVIQDHRWLPLEDTHPEFARRYYKRKEEAHTSQFHERRRRTQAHQEKQETKTEYQSAQRKRILSNKDD